MWTVVGFSQSVAGAAVQTPLDALVDEHVSFAGDLITVPELNKIIGYYAVGLDIQNAQLVTPQLRRLAPISIAPVEDTILPVFPPDFAIRPLSPVELMTDEALSAEAGNSNVGAQQESILVLLSDGVVAPVTGEIITVLASATAPATAYAWANAPITLVTQLPVGTYDLVGARVEQANTISYRFVFVGGIWRPGYAAVGAISAKDPNMSRYGKLGVWGSFSHLHIPSIDFFGDGTGGAVVIYLDLIKRA